MNTIKQDIQKAMVHATQKLICLFEEDSGVPVKYTYASSCFSCSSFIHIIIINNPDMKVE